MGTGTTTTDIANPSWVLPASPVQRPAPKSLADTYPKPTQTSTADSATTTRPVPLSASPFLRSGPTEVRRSDAAQSSVKKTISAVSRLGTQSPFVRQLSSTATSGGGGGGQPSNPRRVSSPMRASPFAERSDKAGGSDAGRESHQGTPLAHKFQKEMVNEGSPLRPFSARGRKSMPTTSSSPKAPRRSFSGTVVMTAEQQTRGKKGKAHGNAREDEEMKPVETAKRGGERERESVPGGFPGEEDEEEQRDGIGHDVEMREVSTSPVTRKRAQTSAPPSTPPRRSARLSVAATKDPGQGAGDNRKARRRTKK
jgi:hypothetical protein